LRSTKDEGGERGSPCRFCGRESKLKTKVDVDDERDGRGGGGKRMWKVSVTITTEWWHGQPKDEGGRSHQRHLTLWKESVFVTANMADVVMAEDGVGEECVMRHREEAEASTTSLTRGDRAAGP